MSTRAQRFAMAARMADEWVERLGPTGKEEARAWTQGQRLRPSRRLGPSDRRALANFLDVIRQLLREAT